MTTVDWISFSTDSHLRSLLCALSLGLTLLLSGCAGVFLAGVGVGAYSYVSGKVIRMYEADYERTVDASLRVMEELNLERRDETSAGKKTIIEGSRADQTPITIEVEYVDEGWTEIGIRTGQIGIDNLDVSEQVHELIAEQLNRRPVRTARPTAAKQENAPEDSAPKKPQKTADTPAPAPATEAVSASLPASVGQPSAGSKENLSLFSAGRKKTFVYYQASELAIPKGAYGALDEIAAYLSLNPSATVDIRGYTDSSGKRADNLVISKKRAFAIRDYLVGNGVSPERISADGLGATNFLESNRTEKLRKMNRRVEITIK